MANRLPLHNLAQDGAAAGYVVAWDNTVLQWIARALTAADVPGVAPLASPVFTGDPQAPTPATSDNDTSVATTAFVKAVVASYAPLASPTFTGDPKAPTPAPGDNDTSIATTAFVAAAITAARATTLLVPMVGAPGGGDPDLIWTDDGELLMIEVPL